MERNTVFLICQVCKSNLSIHPLIFSSFNFSFIPSSIYPFILSYSSIHSFLHLFIHSSSIYSFIHSFVHSSVHLSIHSSLHLSIHSSVHLSIHCSSIYSSIHLFSIYPIRLFIVDISKCDIDVLISHSRNDDLCKYFKYSISTIF